ncbi:hypothetical protein C8J57DRAFT_1514082 [Mycena rebaudengoi]|nr:hypothetical protein C8J57DRAFT_1514082 [Mycena rebaudengoi]
MRSESLRETRTFQPLDFSQALMYSSKLFPVSIAALVALFVHSPTAVSAAAVEDRAPPLCHVVNQTSVPMLALTISHGLD